MSLLASNARSRSRLPYSICWLPTSPPTDSTRRPVIAPYLGALTANHCTSLPSHSHFTRPIWYVSRQPPKCPPRCARSCLHRCHRRHRRHRRRRLLAAIPEGGAAAPMPSALFTRSRRRLRPYVPRPLPICRLHSLPTSRPNEVASKRTTTPGKARAKARRVVVEAKAMLVELGEVELSLLPQSCTKIVTMEARTVNASSVWRAWISCFCHFNDTSCST